MEEAWLRGPLPGIDARVAPLLYSFEQVREDLARWTDGLTPDQMWARPHGLAPVGFHVRHIGGSVERLMTYLQGGPLTDAQQAALHAEMNPGAAREELLRDLDQRLAAAEAQVRAIHPAALAEPRMVGRKKLPTTVAGLLTHIAEHTQRHTGQAIVTAQIVRAGG
jgi:uncharacterized damage-inducible protein DinB